MKPLLKWAGGKTRLAPQILRALGPGGRLVEPFVGSGAVWLALAEAEPDATAYLADVSPAVVAVHRAVRDSVDDVLLEVAGLPVGPDWREQYQGVLDVFNWLVARDVDRADPRVAARMLWLNRAAFNGLYRVNRGGRANMPAGDAVDLKLPAEARIREVSAALQRAEIVCADFRTAMMAVRAGDRVYLDPPYFATGDRPAFVAYAAGGFTERDQAEVARLGLDAAARGARVVATNADVPASRKLYRPRLGWDVHLVDAGRSIGAGTSKNPERPAARRQAELLVIAGVCEAAS